MFYAVKIAIDGIGIAAGKSFPSAFYLKLGNTFDNTKLILYILSSSIAGFRIVHFPQGGIKRLRL